MLCGTDTNTNDGNKEKSHPVTFEVKDLLIFGDKTAKRMTWINF